MESQLKVSFFLNHAKRTKTRQTPIYLRIRYNYDHVTVSTGQFIAAANWDKKAKKVKGHSGEAASINEALKTLEVRVRSVVNQMILHGKPFNVYSIKDALTGTSKQAYTLKDAFATYLGMIKSLEGRDYSPITHGKYRQTYDRVLEFAKHKFKRNDFYLYDLDDAFMEEFELYLKIRIGNNQTTIYKHWQRLSRVVRYAMRKKMIHTFPFVDYSIRLPRKKVEYLTKGEVEAIESKDFGSERLNSVKAFFLFSIYSGLAYTEIFNLSESHIVVGVDGEKWIDMYRQKTKKPYSVPLLPRALQIIDQFKDHPYRKKTGKLFPIPTNQKMNAYLKEIQDVCKIKTKLTCHLARKTFSCTIMLLNGVSIQVLSECLGHSSPAVTIAAYSSVLPEMVVKEFGMLRKKLS
ncbi:MAG: site-specific integrase [Flavobacterium sp.]|nr:MAG: site-specific integrase [Flavobacterium sp.]